jgi:transcriptional regulator with XRE-family HTH domain
VTELRRAERVADGSPDTTGRGAADSLDWGVADEIRAIGAEIRRLRRDRGMPLRELSARTGLSTGFLSLVERGLSSLALTSLYTVAQALDTDVGHFFPQPDRGQPPHPLPHIGRGGEVETTITSSRRTYRLLSPRAPGKVLEPLLVTIQPTDTDTEPYAHDGEEFCYVLEGELTYVIEDREHRLGTGDSIHMRSTTPHAIRNDSGKPVEAVWVLTPPLLR